MPSLNLSYLCLAFAAIKKSGGKGITIRGFIGVGEENSGSPFLAQSLLKLACDAGQGGVLGRAPPVLPCDGVAGSRRCFPMVQLG